MPHSPTPVLWLKWLKLALVPILALSLLALIWPRRNSELDTSTSEPLSVRRPPRDSRSATALKEQGLEAHWSAIVPLGPREINPFAPLPLSISSQVAQRETENDSTDASSTITSPSSSDKPAPALVKVKAVHQINGVYCAVVDDRLVYVGDKLADGRHVSAITDAGITVISK